MQIIVVRKESNEMPIYFSFNYLYKQLKPNFINSLDTSSVRHTINFKNNKCWVESNTQLFELVLLGSAKPISIEKI